MAKTPKFFTATAQTPQIDDYGVSCVKCTKITQPKLNLASLRKLLPNITAHATDGYQYRRTVYGAEVADKLKIKICVYTYHDMNKKDYTLTIERNSHIKQGAPEADTLLSQHKSISYYESGGDCWVNVLHADYSTPAALMETLQKFLEEDKQ